MQLIGHIKHKITHNRGITIHQHKQCTVHASIAIYFNNYNIENKSNASGIPNVTPVFIYEYTDVY